MYTNTCTIHALCRQGCAVPCPMLMSNYMRRTGRRRVVCQCQAKSTTIMYNTTKYEQDRAAPWRVVTTDQHHSMYCTKVPYGADDRRLLLHDGVVQ